MGQILRLSGKWNRPCVHGCSFALSGGLDRSEYQLLRLAECRIDENHPEVGFPDVENIFKDFHERLLARQKMSTIEHPDLMMHINDYNAEAVPSEKLSEAEIEQNVLAIIVGGFETLTTTFSGAFHYLLAHPRKLDRLTKEIRSAFSSPSQISASAVSKLPYLNAVIDETLRLCPPIPDMLRRQVTRDTPVTIAGRVVPAGTTVSVSCYSMFKSADYFSAPEVFEPERFLVKSGTNSVHDEGSPLAHNDFSAFHPFSLGPHNCLGQPLARLEMRLLLVLFLYSFDVRTPPDVELRAWTEQKIYWTWEKQSLPVQLSRA
jgi:cytochrome P450